jgi:hypothetical protein
MRSTTTICLAALGLVALTAVGMAFPPAPKEKVDPNPPLDGPYVHVALYTFKATAPKGTVQDFIADAEKCFGQIAEVKGVRVGAPAKRATAKAAGVEPKGDYHVAVVLTFDGYGGLAKYGNHPRHNELKKKYARFFEKIVTYDFER